MNSKLYTRLALCSLIVFSACTSAVERKQQWFRGNLHTHSYWSDGDEYPEMIMDWYKNNGYQFVALSDHNILAEGEKWVTVAKSRMYEESFEEYFTKFGDKWVVHNRDSGRINVRLKTYDEYKTLFQDSSFLIIQSEEITDKTGDKLIHMNATNIHELIEPQGGKNVRDVMQRNVDAVLKQRKETGIPMFVHINHPNFFYSITADDIIGLRGEQFFEVYNGHPLVNNYGDSVHQSTEQMWDKINAAYVAKGQPLLLGLATDDSHNYHQFGSAYSNAGRGWVMVYAFSLTPQSLIEAMEAGNFYASTGVTLDEISLKDNTLTIRVKPEPQVDYTISFIGLENGKQETRTLREVEGTSATFPITAEIAFVRARIRSSKTKQNPFHDGDVEMAWTQPVSFKK